MYERCKILWSSANYEVTIKENEQTIVADKNNLASSMKTLLPRQMEYEIAVMTVENEENKDQYILGERQFYIGRKESSDLVFADESVSRVHAYISYEKHRHILNDTNSLNGTYINKTLIMQQTLKHGDKIHIGNILLTYEAL